MSEKWHLRITRFANIILYSTCILEEKLLMCYVLGECKATRRSHRLCLARRCRSCFRSCSEINVRLSPGFPRKRTSSMFGYVLLVISPVQINKYILCNWHVTCVINYCEVENQSLLSTLKSYSLSAHPAISAILAAAAGKIKFCASAAALSVVSSAL